MGPRGGVGRIDGEDHCYGDETPYVKTIAEQHEALELDLVDAKGLGHYHEQDELLHATEMPSETP